MRPEPGARPATFAEFGRALVAEACGPEMLRARLETALDAVARDGIATRNFDATIDSVRVETPELVTDDGRQRVFAVRVRVRLTTGGVGPRLLAVDVSSRLTVDLTVRLRAFSPAVLQLDIDPLTARDIRIRARARSGLLPLPLVGGGSLTGLNRNAEDSLPGLVKVLNAALAAGAEQRRFDVLDRLGAAPASSAREPIGTPLPFAEFGETLMRRGISLDFVRSSVDADLASRQDLILESPPGTAHLELLDIHEESTNDRELKFRLALRINCEIIGTTGVAIVRDAWFHAELTLRVHTLVKPATVVVDVAPVEREAITLMRVRRRLGGHLVRMPRRALADELCSQLVDQLNAQVPTLGRRIVATGMPTDRAAS
jgi:hypothetical protein